MTKAKRSVTAIVQPNLLDKIITVLSPKHGLARQNARRMGAVMGAWVGARFDRKATQAWMVANGSADADSLPDLPTLRIRCRDLMRNASLAGGAVTNLVRDVVGTGLSVHPKPDWEVLGMTEDESIAWAEKAYREFELYAASKDCDITRTLNFYELQSLVFRAMLESGDVFINLPQVAAPGALYKTRLQVIEADRVESPNGDGQTVKYLPSAAAQEPVTSGPVWGGVECDVNGAPVAYYILDEHPGSMGFSVKPNAWKRYSVFGSRTNRRLILHIFDQERPDQKRGVPYLAPVIEQLKQLARYTDAEIMAAVITSMYTVFIESPFPQDVPIPTPQQGKVSDMELGNGTINTLGPGEKIAFANPLRPNTAFDAFILALCRQIGMRLGIPFEVLVKHFTASYSAARAALLDFWKLVKNRRAFLATGFCEPVYQTWMDEAVAAGILAAPGYFTDARIRKAYQRCECVGDAMGQINPKDEVAASLSKIEGGLSSIEREAMKMEGVSWLEIHRQRKREHAARVEAGLEPAIGNANATEPVIANQPDPNKGSDIEAPEAA